MIHGYHCTDNNTVCRKVEATVSSQVHQINTTLDFKIPRELLNYISTTMPYSGNEFWTSILEIESAYLLARRYTDSVS